LASATITVILMLTPVLWIHLDREATDPKRVMDRLMGFLAFAGFVFLLPSLSYSLFSPAHDAVALGFGAIATAGLCRRQANTGAAHHLVSAVAAILSVWAKQTMIALVFALPLYVVFADGILMCRSDVCFVFFIGVDLCRVFLMD